MEKQGIRISRKIKIFLFQDKYEKRCFIPVAYEYFFNNPNYQNEEKTVSYDDLKSLL